MDLINCHTYLSVYNFNAMYIQCSELTQCHSSPLMHCTIVILLLQYMVQYTCISDLYNLHASMMGSLFINATFELIKTILAVASEVSFNLAPQLFNEIEFTMVLRIKKMLNFNSSSITSVSHSCCSRKSGS